MGLQVAGATKALVAYLALMWFLSCVYQEVLLKVGQLGEVFSAGLTPEWPLSTVHSQVYLEVGQLAKDLAADVALVPYFPVLPGERVGQGFVADVPSSLGLSQVHGVLRAALSRCEHCRSGSGWQAVVRGGHAYLRRAFPGCKRGGLPEGSGYGQGTWGCRLKEILTVTSRGGVFQVPEIAGGPHCKVVEVVFLCQDKVFTARFPTGLRQSEACVATCQCKRQ